MSVSIYYSATRETPLTQSEQAAIDTIISRYSIDAHVEHYMQTLEGHNGEDFRVYDYEESDEPELIFDGATKLPSNDIEKSMELSTHWCNLLSEIRRIIKDADWSVNIDDLDIEWDEASQSYLSGE